MYVVVVGNPFDGLEVHGAWEDANDANEWASEQFAGDTWWVVEVKKAS